VRTHGEVLRDLEKQMPTKVFNLQFYHFSIYFKRFLKERENPKQKISNYLIFKRHPNLN
jgi:hypothetical protein